MHENCNKLRLISPRQKTWTFPEETSGTLRPSHTDFRIHLSGAGEERLGLLQLGDSV